MPLETVSEVRVRYAETDQMGVVYHANYLVWCEIGRTDFIRALGTPYAQLERDGVVLAVSDATMRYHASAKYDDAIRIHTRLADVRSRAITFTYRIVNADTGVLLVSASTGLVSLSTDGRLVALPQSVRTMLDGAVAPVSAVGAS
jgi:acyl-CoA thioester hydrolase